MFDISKYLKKTEKVVVDDRELDVQEMSCEMWDEVAGQKIKGFADQAAFLARVLSRNAQGVEVMAEEVAEWPRSAVEDCLRMFLTWGEKAQNDPN